jgi:hypothetical protein
MGVIEAGVWGLVGGLAAGLVSTAAAVQHAKFRWPWRGNEDGIWPRLFVTAVGLVVGAIVAGAMHSQISAAYPALLVGVGAPSVIRGALHGVEVGATNESAGGVPAPQAGGKHADAV